MFSTLCGLTWEACLKPEDPLPKELTLMAGSLVPAVGRGPQFLPAQGLSVGLLGLPLHMATVSGRVYSKGLGRKLKVFSWSRLQVLEDTEDSSSSRREELDLPLNQSVFSRETELIASIYRSSIYLSIHPLCIHHLSIIYIICLAIICLYLSSVSLLYILIFILRFMCDINLIYTLIS